MAGSESSPRRRRFSRAATLLSERRGVLGDYMAAIGGSGGRLVFSLVYFISLANTLSIGDFGVFATASAAGVMLSPILAFGFVSTLYRVATVKPRLIGTFTAGFLVLSALSLPVLALASWAVHRLFFGDTLALRVFARFPIAARRPAAVLGDPAGSGSVTGMAPR